MIHKPPIDELAQKVGSKYSLCVVASKRARQIAAGSTPLTKVQEDSAVTIAVNEIAEGKVTIC